jgi:cobalt/nickel transport system permease protein
MAHLPDGILAAPVLVAGASVALAGTAIGLKRLDPDRIPQAGVLSALFFVGSLVHFPVGPGSVHLLLNGLVGIMLGWAAFPAILVALTLQALMFGFGGLVVLGVNVMNMAVPAVLCGLVFSSVIRARPAWCCVAAGLCAAAAVAMSASGMALSLAASGQEFSAAAKLALVSHLPVMAIEAVFTGAVVGLLRKVRPESLALSPGTA